MSASAMDQYQFGENFMRRHRGLLFLASLLLLATAAFAQVGNIEGSVSLPHMGGPAVGAVVQIQHMPHDSLSTTTDSTGHYHFTSVPIGEWGVHAYLAPYQPAAGFARVLTAMTAHVNLVFNAPLTGFGRIEGIVLRPNPMEGPAAGATVLLLHMADTLRTTTNDSGRFVFDSVAVGGYDLRAYLTGYEPAFGGVQVFDGVTAHPTLVLRPLPTNLGRVEGLILLPFDGGPAIGATVALRVAPGDTGLLVTQTNNFGHFVFEAVHVGHHDIDASLAGFMPAHASIYVPESGTAHITLRLGFIPTGGGTVAGSVMFRDQTPVIRACVTLSGRPPLHFVTATDSLGHFVFPRIPAGEYEVTAALPMHGFASTNVAVIDSQTTQVTLVLERFRARRPARRYADRG